MCVVLYPCCVGVFGMFAITKRTDMGLYEVSLSVGLLSFGNYISQLPYVRYYVFCSEHL